MTMICKLNMDSVAVMCVIFTGSSSKALETMRCLRALSQNTRVHGCVSEFDLVTRASAILATAAASGPEALAAAVVFYANWDAPPLATEIE
jgi:hypothetical protein